MPALPLLHLALDVFISVAQPDASALSVHLVHGLLQEILEPQVLLTDRTRQCESARGDRARGDRSRVHRCPLLQKQTSLVFKNKHHECARGRESASCLVSWAVTRVWSLWF